MADEIELPLPHTIDPAVVAAGQIEAMLEQRQDIHLSTDTFNSLCDIVRGHMKVIADLAIKGHELHKMLSDEPGK